MGDELRFAVDSTDHVSSAEVSFRNGSPFSPGTAATGAMLRGENSEFTIYDRHIVRCPEPDQDSAVYAIGITFSDLNYMCKEGSMGYVPTESWARKDGTECLCTLDISADCSVKDGGI